MSLNSLGKKDARMRISRKSLVAGPAAIAVLLTALVSATGPASASTPAPAASSAASVSLAGSGTASDPYQITDAADLATAIAAVNADTTHTGAAIADYELTANIDFGGQTTSGFDYFGGTFNGQGYTISDVNLTTDSSSIPDGNNSGQTGDFLGLFKVVNLGTLENIGLDDVTATAAQPNGGYSYAAAPLAASVFGSTVTGNSVYGSTVTSTGGDVGGLVGHAYSASIQDWGAAWNAGDANSTVISDNMVTGTTLTGAYAVGGILVYGQGTVTVNDNYVAATIDETGGAPSSAQAAGEVVGNTTSNITGGSGDDIVAVSDNVVGGGWITYATGGTRTGYAGVVFGGLGDAGNTSWTESGDLVSPSFTLDSNLTGGPYSSASGNADGTLSTTAALATQSTYTGLGWNFTSAWQWDSVRNSPTVSNFEVSSPAGTTYALGDPVTPVVSYNFNGDSGTTVTDSSGNGNNGTWSGTPAYQAGFDGEAAYVNSDTNYISLPRNAQTEVTTGSESVEFWYNESSAVGDGVIFGDDNWNSGETPGLVIFNTNGTDLLGVNLGDGSSTRVKVTSLGTPLDDVWTYVTVVVNRSTNTMTTYENGAVVDTASIAGTTGSLDGLGDPYRIGQDGTGTYANYVDGLVDDLNFYNQAITPGQIAADYAATNPSNFAYKVTVTNDGHGTGTASTATTGLDDQVTLTATPGTGYHFAAWVPVTPADLQIGSDGTFTDPGTAVTVEATFAPNTYTVNFDGNGADGGSTAPQTLTYDQAADLTANGFTRSGYTFAGWTTTAASAAPTYDDQASVENLAASGSVTLYAQWIPDGSYPLTVSGDAHVQVSSSAGWYAAAGSTVTLTATPDTGYHSTWQVVSPFGLAVGSDGTFTMPDSAVVINAVSAANTYTIHFDGNGATGGSMTDQTLTYGQSTPLEANGYTYAPSGATSSYGLIGWATSPHGAPIYPGGQAVENLTATNGATVILYARWGRLRAAGDAVAPVASYDFDHDYGSTVVDSSGLGNNATWSGTPAYAPGISGLAAHVENGDGTITLPDVAGETDGSGSFSFSTWVGVYSEDGTGQAALVSNAAHDCVSGLQFYDEFASNPELCLGAYTTVHVGGSLGAKWNYLSLVVNVSTDTVTNYVNGVEVGSYKFPSGYQFDSGYAFTLGLDAQNDDGIDALLDDFDFYNQVISPAQILNDYNATKPASTTLPAESAADLPASSSTPDLPAGFVSDTYHAPAVRTGDAVSEQLAGLWNADPYLYGSNPVTYTKVSGDSWLSVNPATGVVSGTAPGSVPQHPGTITVQATDGTNTSQIMVEVPVIGATSAPQVNAATWNLWDAGSNVAYSLPKELAVIAASGLDVIGVQEDGGTVAQQLATSLGWSYYESSGGLGIVSAYPISSTGVVDATSTAPATGVTVNVLGRNMRVWSVGLDPTSAASQATQAQAVATELQGDISGTEPTFVLADLESSANAADFTNIGLTDSFRKANPDATADPGDTLLFTSPSDRADYVYYAGPRVKDLSSSTLTAGWPGATANVDSLWTSNHAAVVTEFQLGGAGQPLHAAPALTVARPELAFQVGSTESTAALAKAIGARVVPGNATITVDDSAVDYSAVGSYTAMVTATDSDGYVSNPVPVTVQVVPHLQLTLTNTTATFNVGDAITGPAVVSQLIPGPGEGTALTISVGLNGVNRWAAGTYPVTVTATDEWGFTSTQPATVVVQAPYRIRVARTPGGTASASEALGQAGDTVTLTETPATGYTFSTWRVTQLPNGPGITVGSGGAFTMPSAAVSVTPVFTPNTYTVTFDGNGAAGGQTANETLTYNRPEALSRNGFTNPGNTFLGWATSAGGPVVYANGQVVRNLTATDGATVSLYAVWTPVQVSATVSPALPDGDLGWYTTAPTITASATDSDASASVTGIKYQLNGGGWQDYTAPLTAPDGVDTYQFEATDSAGNTSAVITRVVRVDATAPTVAAAQSTGSNGTTVTISATDAASGVVFIQYSLDDGTTWLPYLGPILVPDSASAQTVEYRAASLAGLTSTVGTLTIAATSSAS